MIITQLSRETINLANKIYKFHYEAKIYHLNSQMEVNFKRFSMNSRRWKCATSTGKFYLTRICSLFLKYYKNEYIQYLSHQSRFYQFNPTVCRWFELIESTLMRHRLAYRNPDTSKVIEL